MLGGNGDDSEGKTKVRKEIIFSWEEKNSQ
jgi:hypothetical protein